MNSLEYQLELINQIQDYLEDLIYKIEQKQQRYEEYIAKLEANGLMDNFVAQLRETHLASTSALLNELVEQVQRHDIPVAKELEENLEDLIRESLF